MTNPVHPLRNVQLQAALEEIVSDRSGREWRIRDFRDMNDFASHPSALLSDGSYSVFVKLNTAANGMEQFEIELAGLRFLSEQAGVSIPAPLGNLAVEGGVVMVLEAVRSVERTPGQWRQIGQALAQIHRTKGSQFGLDTHNYFGPLYQDNRFLDDWPTFYAERRLWPRFVGAINAGNMPTDVIRSIEKLILRLPELCGPEVTPTLLHGDAQHHNFVSTENGAVVIDPAPYFGHPEMDLAYVDYFHPMPEDVLNAYRDELPIDPGFVERRELWRIYGYLAATEVGGVEYLARLTAAVRKYL